MAKRRKPLGKIPCDQLGPFMSYNICLQKHEHIWIEVDCISHKAHKRIQLEMLAIIYMLIVKNRTCFSIFLKRIEELLGYVHLEIIIRDC